jgi:hypothetical protein
MDRAGHRRGDILRLVMGKSSAAKEYGRRGRITALPVKLRSITGITLLCFQPCSGI